MNIQVVFYRLICPQFQNSPFEKFTLSLFLTSVITAAIPAMLLIVMISFGIMHCWLHVMSEITGYCDRVFYEDWWNAQSFAGFGKKWNLMIYCWSFNYFLLPVCGVITAECELSMDPQLMWCVVTLTDAGGGILVGDC